jgi:hypothetical protein
LIARPATCCWRLQGASGMGTRHQRDHWRQEGVISGILLKLVVMCLFMATSGVVAGYDQRCARQALASAQSHNLRNLLLCFWEGRWSRRRILPKAMHDIRVPRPTHKTAQQEYSKQRQG